LYNRENKAEMTMTTLKAQFEKNGFVVLKHALDEAAVKYYIDAIDELKPQFRKRTWTIPDGVTRHREFWPLILNDKTIEAVRSILGDGIRFCQHDDIHFGFSSFAWHRDSVNRKYGDLPNWKEDDQHYELVRVGYYFQPPGGGFRLGMIPGSHRPQLHYNAEKQKAVEGRITDMANITAKARGIDRFSEEAEWISPEPGDAVIFDPRTIHTGSEFKGDKYSCFVAYGNVNRHYQEHYQYYRYLRKDLKYRALDSELIGMLEEKDLFAGEGQTVERIDGAWIPSEVFNYFAGFFK
jgi:hypothetical protein